MKLKQSQRGWAPLAIFSIIISVALVGGILYLATDGGTKNPFADLVDVAGVHDPDPDHDDECEKDPNCYH